MKYFTKKWYNNGCIFSEKETDYKRYYEKNKYQFPKTYRDISLHDAEIISIKKDRHRLSIKILLSDHKQAIRITLKDQNIIEICDLKDKICLADEFYIENDSFEFHLLLSDEKNELFYFTSKCSDFTVIKLPELQIHTLLYYSLPNQLLYSEKYYYDSETKAIVDEANTDKGVDTHRYFPLPHISSDDLLYDFLTKINSRKIDSYLACFQNDTEKRKEAEYEIRFLQKNRTIRVSDCLSYKYYCLNLLKPIAEKWSKETGIALDSEISKPEHYILEQETNDNNLYVPTDGIFVSEAINFCTEKDIVFSKKIYIYSNSKNSIKESEEFLEMPYCSEKRIQEAFFNHSNSMQKNKISASSQDLKDYFDFRKKYLSRILIQWCKKNSIKYIET